MLSPRSAARVLQSLIEAELKTQRGPSSRPGNSAAAANEVWHADLSLRDGTGSGLGLDSLETMAIGAAVNEMFHLYESTSPPDLMEIETFGGWLKAIEEAWDQGISKITFLTSGSTGLPRRYTHDATFLIEEAQFLAGYFQSCRRIIALTPAHHIYGCILTAFLADELGVEVIAETTCTHSFLNHELVPGDLVVTFPDRWAAINRTVSAWPPGVNGVVSTAPCPAQLVMSLLERGLSGMTELYGSTETAGIGWRRHPDDGFTLMPHWRFPNSDGDPAGSLTRLERGEQSYDVPDEFIRTGNRSFTVGARRDGGVQVGGVNVWPQRVAAELERHPEVERASVRLKSTPSGARLKAFIVPVSANAEIGLHSRLDQWCMQRLSAVECPKSWTFGTNLPTNEFGKASDWVE